MTSEARDYLNGLHERGLIEYGDYSRLFDLIADLEGGPPDQPHPNLHLEHGKWYWVMFTDGSRIKVEAWADKYGNIDINNEPVEWGLWVQGGDGTPVNRNGITSIEEAS